MTKAQAGSSYAKSKRLPSTAVVDCNTDISVVPVQAAERTTTTIRSLSIPLEDQATSYFFNNYLSCNYSSKYSMNACSFVLPILHQQHSSFGVLPKIIDAIGLACISNVKRSQEMMVAARQRYNRALRAINFAIQDSSTVSTDQTLIAVMLLSMFEVCSVVTV